MQRPQSETVTLNDILITEELSQRSPRPPNLQAKVQAMQTLAQQMARDSETMLHAPSGYSSRAMSDRNRRG